MTGRQSSRQHQVRWIIRGDAGLGGWRPRWGYGYSARRLAGGHKLPLYVYELTGPNVQERASTAAYRGMAIVAYRGYGDIALLLYLEI